MAGVAYSHDALGNGIVYQKRGWVGGAGNDSSENHLPACVAEFTAFSSWAIVRVFNLRRGEKERLVSMRRLETK